MTVGPVIVSLCGAAGAGKSTLAVALAATYGEWASRVPADYSLLPPADPAGSLRWDWDRLLADLSRPLGTTVMTPAVDFTTLRRSEDGDRQSFVVRPLMLVDAMQPCPAADLIIRLAGPPDARRARLAERDRRWDTAVLDRWDRLEATVATTDLGPAAHVLDTRRPVAELVVAVQHLIDRHWDIPVTAPS